ncbi:hybrid sensor histidine kinase/response regulator [Blastopirellula marina]|uniref:histidine kinase n=1 Tax=Blastopirellula marina DSM 3645 TaxID=314230 RepID=A3ZNZ4_9BACT|nr:hybrid sensor histidine kinase/response regulator [Blastopirellula marina]EAQ82042.1 putative sensor/response regulator hybrid [Blastopirellula marina DSM 3645]
MPSPDFISDNLRVLILPPTPRDAAITERILNQNHIETFACRNIEHFCEEAKAGAGVLLIAEEHLLGDPHRLAAQMLSEQPAWSDLPFLILTLASGRNAQILEQWQQAAYVTLITRPLQIQPFISVVRSRLQDRKRQYMVRDLLNRLEHHGRQFSQLADAMPQIVFTTTRQGEIEYLNQRALDYFGVSRQEIAGFDWTSTIFESDFANAKIRWERALEKGSSFQCEFRMQHARTLEHRWHLARSLPVLDESGKVIRWFGTVTDIHKQKLIEEKLNLALQQAAAANVVKTEFLANMSHEIRTPMTAILGYAELLAQQETDLEKLHFLKVIRQNGEFLVEIINDILDLSKIEAGKLDITLEPLELSRMIEEIQSLMLVRAAENDIEFNVDFAATVPERIRSDSKRLRQILINLIGNAVKFTQEGSVRLVVSPDAERIQFDVIDTGIGMTQQQVEQLFLPFQQADSSVSRKFGGSGLGLAISQRLAVMLGGEITVQSQQGQGSVFTLSIPNNLAGHTSVEPARSLPSANAATILREKPLLQCEILLVEDRQAIRFLAGRILTNAGASVQFAENGLEATQLVQRLHETNSAPDIVLMDMQMPVMDGFHATARLREMGFNRPIIALTADAMQGDMDRCIASGCNAYVSKPIDTAELLQVIARYVTPTEDNAARDAERR